MRIKITKTEYVNIPFKELRLKAGLSLRELERRSGVGFSYISKIENEIIDTTPDIWKKLKPHITIDKHRDIAQSGRATD